jgi:multisubunit Na+/H+ antiporter MnhB subunit
MSTDVIDTGLSLLLLLLAYKALFTEDLLAAIVSFVGVGLIAALMWAYQSAPDIAIAEAAIGAGVTGALLLVTWNRLGQPTAPLARYQGLVAIATTTVVLAAGLYFFTFWQPGSMGLSTLVNNNLIESGVNNPVTAVLLNYRSFDTLMEIAVLFVTLVGLRALKLELPPVTIDLNPVVRPLIQIMFPLIFLLGGYTLWAGADYPGGAFQAGAIWAGALVLLYFSGVLTSISQRMSGAAVWGLAIFVAAALITYALSGVVLSYVLFEPGIWILVIEAFAAISIAVTLFSMFVPKIRLKQIDQ